MTDSLTLFLYAVDESQSRQAVQVKRKRVPAGTSDYQAAWIVEESDSEVVSVCEALT